MTGKRSSRERSGGGRGLLLVLALVLLVSVVKYADIPWARSVRERAAEALTGAPGIERALAVLGGAAEDGTQEVFQPGDTAADQDAAYAVSSGGADDILGREQTLFPDAVDETVYPMEFAHALPVSGTQTSDFGSRLSPVTGQPGFHYGLDLAADEGTPIAAFADGTVREVGESSYGKYLILDHDDGFATLYAHCSSISAGVGDTVACGEQIAAVGQTGNATGPHLHLELWKNGAALDPAAYLTGL